MKQFFKRGTWIQIVDYNGEPSSKSFDLDEDQYLKIGDMFTYMPKKDNIKLMVMKVTGSILWCRIVR